MHDDDPSPPFDSFKLPAQLELPSIDSFPKNSDVKSLGNSTHFSRCFRGSLASNTPISSFKNTCYIGSTVLAFV